MLITAAEIARAHGLDPKRYRQALRNAKLPWYAWGAPWTVEVGSTRHQDMLRVLSKLLDGGAVPRVNRAAGTVQSASRRHSDEAYIIDLCDSFLNRTAVRQHKFPFLRGDAGARERGKMLPVDAWYPDLALVIEYRERQHSEAVGFFDRRMTVSGLHRGDQRRLYDQRRRATLPEHGISLVELDYFEFDHGSGKRLVRGRRDRDVIAAKLATFAK